MQGFFSAFILTGLGMLIAGPVGAIIGFILACLSMPGEQKSKYTHNFTCPYCDVALGCDSYGYFNCYKCNELMEVSEHMVSKSSRFDVICPYCDGTVLIESEGSWTCPHCDKEFNYGENSNNNSFLYLLMALLAKMSKSDGPITDDQIDIVYKIINKTVAFNSIEIAMDYFREIKDDNTSFFEYCDRYCENVNNNSSFDSPHEILLETLDFLYQIAMSDNILSSKETEFINSASRIFKIPKEDFENLKNEYTNEIDDKYYEILGCKSGDSLEKIKSQYRKLVKQYHPDKISNLDLPDYLKQDSLKKFREVQEAYEALKDVM